MVKGTTASGFKFTVDPALLTDMEFVELAGEVQENGTLLPKLIKMILGDEQKKALYDHVRGEDGRVSVTAVADEIVEIFGILSATEETKK
jgi:hypothetical protein